MSGGYLDVDAHIKFMEGKLYEGEWDKAWGLIVKDNFKAMYYELYSFIKNEKNTYYRLYKGHKQLTLEKMFIKLTAIITKGFKAQVKKTKEQKVFISGYINSYMMLLYLNYFLDDKIDLKTFLDTLLKTFRPSVKK